MAVPAPGGKERGIALLFLLILIGIAGVFFLVSIMNKSGATQALARDQKTQAALDRAKQALLSYVATVYAENAMYSTSAPMYSTSHSPNRGVPGYFPCPEMSPPTSNPEGSAAASCGLALVSAIGRLPWYTLNVEPLRGGSGECLWYAVSGTYKFDPNGVTASTGTSNLMNWDTPGLFDVLAADGSTYLAGNSPAARAVAVIFAPGGVLQGLGQDRSGGGAPICGGNYNAANYLDLETASVINNSSVSPGAGLPTRFIAGRTSGTFNDRLVYITRDEVWAAIKKRPDFQAKLDALTQKVARCIAQYGKKNNAGSSDKRLPWATSLSLSNYAVDSLYLDNEGALSGRVSYLLSNSRSDTSNNLSSPYYLFAAASYCFTGGILDDHDLNWYSNWKEHFFYALSYTFQPSSGSSTSTCSSTNCVKVNQPSGALNAAVVMFAGERLAALNQVRDTNADRANIANYLEGRNASNHPNSSGNGNYQSGAASATFNDLLYCIREDLTVVPCP
jgi:hypothetical protein